jgi:hypothetical protein
VTSASAESSRAIIPRFLKRFWHHTRADRFKLIAIQQRFNSKERLLGTLRQQRHDAIDASAAEHWMPRMSDGIATLRHRKVRILRDYGRFDRREAPQYYEDAKGHDTLHARPTHAG